MVFQEESTVPVAHVTENVAFPLEIAGMAQGATHRTARGTSSIWSASAAFERRYPAGIVRAACASASRSRARSPPEPKILLMDEPFGALDEQTRLLLGDKVLQIQAPAEADLPADHPQHHRRPVQLADRVLVMTYRPGHGQSAWCRSSCRARARRKSYRATRSGITWRRSGAICARKRAAACATTRRIAEAVRP
jgi:NitT/TauT family transport system ATP-binding protein